MKIRNVGVLVVVMCVLAVCGGYNSTGAEAEKAPLVLNYNIYGKLHVSADSLDNGKDSDFYLSSNSSRIGLKGSSVIEEGRNVIWQVESGINADETGSTFATRDTYAGLSDERMGTILAGYYDSPCKSLTRQVDLFGDRIGDMRNIAGVTDYGFNLRLKNVLVYKTPNTNGLMGCAAYTAEEEVEDSNIASVGVNYKKDNLFVGAAYEEHGEGLTPIDTNGDSTNDSPSEVKEKAYRVAGSYKIKDVSISALYEILNDVDGVEGSDCSTWGAGIGYTIGSNVLKTQFYSRDGEDNVSNSGSDMVVVGIDRKLNNKALVYIAYAAVDNADSANITMSGGGHGDKVRPSAAGEDPSGFSVGLIYDF